MCNPASFVLTKTNVYWSKNSDHHDTILEENNLRDTFGSKIQILRVEITPPDGDIFSDPEGWVFQYDQDILPDWAEEKKDEARARKALEVWHARKIITSGVHRLDDGGEFFVDNATVNACDNATVNAYARGNATVNACDNATVNAWGNATVNARGNATVNAYTRGNATVNACDNATVKAWDNASVNARGNATVKARGNATVKACGNATVNAWGNATVKAWSNATVNACGNATVKARGNATVKAWDNATVTKVGLYGKPRVFLQKGSCAVLLDRRNGISITVAKKKRKTR